MPYRTHVPNVQYNVYLYIFIFFYFVSLSFSPLISVLLELSILHLLELELKEAKFCCEQCCPSLCCCACDNKIDYLRNIHVSMKPEVTNLFQTPRGMGSCDVEISGEHFEEGVPVLWRPHKRTRLWNFKRLKTLFTTRKTNKNFFSTDTCKLLTFLQAVWRHSGVSLLFPLGWVWLPLLRGPGDGPYSEPERWKSGK